MVSAACRYRHPVYRDIPTSCRHPEDERRIRNKFTLRSEDEGNAVWGKMVDWIMAQGRLSTPVFAGIPSILDIRRDSSHHYAQHFKPQKYPPDIFVEPLPIIQKASSRITITTEFSLRLGTRRRTTKTYILVLCGSEEE